MQLFFTAAISGVAQAEEKRREKKKEKKRRERERKREKAGNFDFQLASRFLSKTDHREINSANFTDQKNRNFWRYGLSKGRCERA